MDTKSLSYPIIPELVGWIQRIEILGVIKKLVWIKKRETCFASVISSLAGMWGP